MSDSVDMLSFANLYSKPLFVIYIFGSFSVVQGDNLREIIDCYESFDSMPLDTLNSTFVMEPSEYFAKLRCVAPYPLDVKFDGLEPESGEIEVNFFQRIEIKNDSTKISYDLMYSASVHLRASVHNAQLTGLYTFFSVENPSQQVSKYVFHAKQRPHLFRVGTKEISWGPNDTKLIFPCRTSAWNEAVKFRIRNKITNQTTDPNPSKRHGLDYDPKVGFIWDTTILEFPNNLDLAAVEFQCVSAVHFENVNVGFILSKRDLSRNLKSYDGNPEEDEEDFLIRTVRLHVLTSQTGAIELYCTAFNGIAYLSNIIATNSRSLNMKLGCALEGKSCASKLIGTEAINSKFQEIKHGHKHGLAYCKVAGTKFVQVKEYYTGLDGNIYDNWEVSMTQPTTIIRIENLNSTMVYSHLNYTFTCSIIGYILVRPLFFILHFKNGSIQKFPRIKEWFALPTTVSETFNLTSDVERVSCSACPWNSSQLVNSSVNIKLKDRQPPKFDMEEESLKFVLNSSHHQINCSATGDEIPNMSWHRTDANNSTGLDNLNVTTFFFPGFSSVNFPRIHSVHAGSYTCVASNSVGSASKTFRINVIEPTEMVIGYGIVLGIPVAFIILTGLCVFFLFQYFYGNQLYFTKQEIEEFRKGIKTELKAAAASAENLVSAELEMAPIFKIANIENGPYKIQYEIPSKEFQIDKSCILGSGQFGIVYKGLYNNEPIAIKTLKSNAEKKYLTALLSELKLMIYVNGHKHVIRLIGANTENLKKGIVYALVEMCPLGSLHSYLRKHEHNFINQFRKTGTSVDVSVRKYSNISLLTDTLYTENLIRWSYQITTAMVYLSSKKVTHGDLATRNVLLSNRDTAKVSDFGLSRKLYKYAIYKKKNQDDPLPWKWMAIESLRSLTFSSKSDVWAFGVTLWEIFALGEEPFPGLRWAPDFVQMLENNLRMIQPRQCSTQIYELMLRCWENNPENRPDFNDIAQFFSDYLSKFKTMTPDQSNCELRAESSQYV